MTSTDAGRPDEVVDTDLDHHSAGFREHNYQVFEELRERCPVAKSSAWGGFWILSSYQAVFDACRDTDVFGSGMAKAVPAGGNPTPFIPIDIDPPQLNSFRKLLLPYMSPKAADDQEGYFRDLATGLIDEFIESGEADLAQQLFTPLPARWILRLLDFDENRWPEWIDWLHSLIHDRAWAPEKSLAAAGKIYQAVFTEIAQRRDPAHPGGGVLSDLIRAEVDGRPLTDDELSGIVVLLLLGGMDTTAGLTGNALIRIAEDPDLRRRLIDDPGALDAAATEEFLRHDTPVMGLTRVVRRDAEFHGRQLKEGDRVMLMFASANRDGEAFDDPDEIRLDRSANRHMAFALGVHRCLGSNFARVMFKVMISETLRRIPDLRISGPIERLPDAADVYAAKHLPVSFTPAARERV